MDLLTTALIGLFVWGNLTASASAQAAPVEAPQFITHPVSLTGYNAVPEQTDSDPFTTASGAYSNPEVVAARSIDLAEKLPFGTVIELVPAKSGNGKHCGLSLVQNQVGYRVVADSMHSRKRNQIDVLLPVDRTVRAAGKVVNPAVALGVCSEVEMRIIGKIDIKEMPKSQAALKRVVEEQALALKKF